MQLVASNMASRKPLDHAIDSTDGELEAAQPHIPVAPRPVSWEKKPFLIPTHAELAKRTTESILSNKPGTSSPAQRTDLVKQLASNLQRNVPKRYNLGVLISPIHPLQTKIGGKVEKYYQPRQPCSVPLKAKQNKRTIFMRADRITISLCYTV